MKGNVYRIDKLDFVFVFFVIDIFSILFSSTATKRYQLQQKLGRARYSRTSYLLCLYL